MVRVIHIAPELPPAVGGVADYTAILSRQLMEVSHETVELVLVHAGKQPVDTISVDFQAIDLSGRCSSLTLADTVIRLADDASHRATILLEYSGYGYSKRGAPLWLTRGLRKVCNRMRLPIITMFHELYATGLPWTSAFWTSPFQYYVIVRLAQLSQGVLTNRPSSVEWLEKLRSASMSSVVFNPICSNVGEPKTLPSFESRESVAVLFGGAARKHRIYRSNPSAVESLLARHEIDAVVDIGPANKEIREAAQSLPVQFEGILPRKDVSEKLKKARLGLISYPVARIGKSGSAAAFFSHGVPIIVFDEGNGTGPGLPYEPGIHYLEANKNGTQGENPDLKSISHASFMQYRKYSHSTLHANRILCLLKTVLEDVDNHIVE